MPDNTRDLVHGRHSIDGDQHHSKTGNASTHDWVSHQGLTNGFVLEYAVVVFKSSARALRDVRCAVLLLTRMNNFNKTEAAISPT